MTSIINNNVAGEITRLQKNMVAQENLAPSENWVPHCPSTNSALPGGKTSPQSLKSSRQTHIFFKPHPPSPFPPFFCKEGGAFYELPPIPDVYLWCRLISTSGRLKNLREYTTWKKKTIWNLPMSPSQFEINNPTLSFSV